MIKKNLDYLKSLSSLNGIDYKTIVREFGDNIASMRISQSGSGYMFGYVSPDEYISCRVSNHLPKLSNYMNENRGRMAMKENGHICTLFFGSREANMLSSSQK